MNKLEIISNSPEYTMKFAKSLANKLNTGDVIILNGELGMGKTKFVEGFLQSFNLQDEISSPTFNIVNEYISNQVKIYHFDVYRLENSDEFLEIGGEEYFESGICLIEWGKIIEDILPKLYIEISFEKGLEENSRILKFIIHGKSINYSNILNKLKEELI